MPDTILPGPIENAPEAARGRHETDSVNVHISKIYDACREKH